MSFTSGGSPRWTSPELLDPSRLDDRDPRPTKESDCYALGMVIYEVRRYMLPSLLIPSDVLARYSADMNRMTV